MSYTIVEAISEYCSDLEEIKETLFYLYNSVTDKKLKNDIEKWFEDNHYCIDCGEEMLLYEWKEAHTELAGNPYEYFSEYMCPNCDSAEINCIRFN